MILAIHSAGEVCMRAVVMLFLGSVSAIASAQMDYSRQQIEERIRPIGQVNIKKTLTKEPAVSMRPSAAANKKLPPGQATYEQYCVVCHRDGVAGAPKFRDSADWGPRLSKQNIDSLRDTAIKGLNAMPAKGTCLTCSPEEIKEAIEYMVPQL